MTLIIGAVTRDYALLASDRRLTFGAGANAGRIADDDACKLVSLCNTCGIGYTGLAQLGGRPTHEWIARTLAAEGCRDPKSAADILKRTAALEVKRFPAPLRRHAFLVVGWGRFKDDPLGLYPFIQTLSNAFDEAGTSLATPQDLFEGVPTRLTKRDHLLRHVGEAMDPQRVNELDRNLGRLVAREVGPKETLRLLMEEIVYTSGWLSGVYGRSTVGSKVLGLCIPRAAVEAGAQGTSMMLAKQPDENSPTFAYFEEGYSELKQYGPTFVCGDIALTGIVTESNPDTGYQSSQVRILGRPAK